MRQTMLGSIDCAVHVAVRPARLQPDRRGVQRDGRVPHGGGKVCFAKTPGLFSGCNDLDRRTGNVPRPGEYCLT